MERLHTFSFQKEHRELGCEDAPPVCESTHLMVCDGLGGSGKDKLSVLENGREKIRTSAYVGARILASYTDSFIRSHYDEMKCGPFALEEPSTEDFRPFVLDWFRHLDDAYAEKRIEIGVAPPEEGGRMLFPSTLASAVLCPHSGKLRMLMMWAGDSRAYWLSSRNGLQQLSMDDSADPFDLLHSTSHMRNCLAHQKGRVHHINYAYTEVEEDGMVFVCSDGVTDYLPSPMTLERVMMLLARSQYDSEEPDFAASFAEKMARVFFRQIYDDTTMAGAFFNIGTKEEFENAFGDRMKAMLPVFEEADEILHRGEDSPGRILGIFRKKAAEENQRFIDIWKAYEGGYQKFRELTIKRIFEDEL